MLLLVFHTCPLVNAKHVFPSRFALIRFVSLSISFKLEQGLLQVNAPPEKLLEAVYLSFLVSTLPFRGGMRSMTCKVLLISSATVLLSFSLKYPKRVSNVPFNINGLSAQSNGRLLTLTVMIFMLVVSFIQCKRNVSGFFFPFSIGRNACLISPSREATFSRLLINTSNEIH